MPEIKLSFGKMDLESDASRKGDTVSALLYNAYRNGDNWHRFPGLTEFADTNSNHPVYVYYSTLHNVCLAVGGENINGYADLYSIASNGAVTLIPYASFAVNTPACFTEDATRILIAANSRIHVYTVATGVLTVLGGQAPENVTWLSVLRGFLVANGQDGGGGGLPGDFGWSNDVDYAVWNYENNAVRPDALQAILTTANDDIFMIGRESIEINKLSDDASAPFYVDKSASQSYGTPAAQSIAFDGQNVYMVVAVGGNRQILRLMNGREPQLISFPVSVPLDDINDLSDMTAYLLGTRGRTFYMLTCPTASITIEDQVQSGLTLAFDIRNEEWYIAGDWDSQSGEYNTFRGVSFAYAEPWQNKRLIGGDDGKIYLLDHSAKKYGEDSIRMALRTGHVRHGTNNVKTAIEYAYDFKAGVGDQTTVNPVFVHRYRSDGKTQWVTRQIKMGASGNTYTPKSHQCGQYKKRQHEFVFTDAVEVIFGGIFEEVEVER